MASKTKSPFEGLRCVHCGEVDCLDVKVEALTVECRACGEPIVWAEVRAMIDTWSRLFAWVASATDTAVPK